MWPGSACPSRPQPPSPSLTAENAQRRCVRGGVVSVSPPPVSPSEQGEAVAPCEDVARMVAVLRGCSAVVGMHPDQAAEAVVDFGLAMGVPFAVVPCCVHGQDFPNRRLNGAHVNTHAQLIEYLCAKDPRVAVASLPFGGQNTVVYLQPQSVGGELVEFAFT